MINMVGIVGMTETVRKYSEMISRNEVNLQFMLMGQNDFVLK